MKKNRIILVDSMGLIYRLYYSIDTILHGRQNINSVYGFCNLLIDLEVICGSKVPIAIVFDDKSKHRKKSYPEYKSHRPPMPEDLKDQIPIIKEAIKSFGLLDLIVEGHEADDVIASYASCAREKDLEVIIVTIDKDLYQLVGDNVVCFDIGKNEVYDKEGVYNKLGVYPKQVVEYLALVGDNSDNIRGVPSVGQVTATRLLRDYTSIENMLSRKIDPNASYYKKLRIIKEQESRSIIEANKNLISLVRDIDLPVKIEQLPLLEITNTKSLNNFLNHYGIDSLLCRLN